ncbi:S41 family peptidase [Aureliella helgolandensis]|uniref:Tricorn protease homolog n=1 Tax=Aureliella helgolandensis TaxID=2527968 RepID=A0A518GFN1_9BACT|nr:S41 family peptidase [Aureliella helgolandensis]QDV27406.1 hypothetical protein Q31a_57950 [Aureliella helgolandensis]
MNAPRFTAIVHRCFLEVLRLGLLVTLGLPQIAASELESRTIRLANHPALAPDGSLLAFSWRGEIWTSQLDGTQLTRLTNNEAVDDQPLFSPDGKSLAFVSNRTGTSQLFVMATDGSSLRQVSYHSEGYSLEDWFPDGKSLLATGSRDHFHRDANRLLQVDLTQRRADKVLVDAMVEDPKLSPDGQRVLFTREGERWWRKGYQGERASQIWQLDLKSGEFTELLHEGVECMWPLWMPDGKGFYFTKGDEQGFDLWRYRFPKQNSKPAKQKSIANFPEDSIVFPAIARDGSVLVFRHLFDLYRLRVGKGEQPQRIDLSVAGDVHLPNPELRREISSAEDVSFTADGLEIAFIAGGDVWVMDTVLREPQRVTHTAGYEASVLFAPDGNSIWFTATDAGQVDLWRASRKVGTQFWWENREFTLEQMTQDSHVESRLTFTPDGKSLLLQQGRGDLVVLDLETNQKRTLVRGFSSLDFDVSPDGQWVAYSQQDNDFNSEIWITSISGESRAVNVSRHPDNEGSPKFSPDGKILAFTGRRSDDERDVYYVYLNQADDQQTSRQRRIEEALELMRKERKTTAEQPSEESSDSKSETAANSQDTKPAQQEDSDAPVQVTIDWEDIHERLRKISIPDSHESDLLFSPDGKKLLFNATVKGVRGWYTVEFPTDLTPKLLSTSMGTRAVWSEEAKGILYLQGGSPAKLESNGKLETYRFKVAQTISRSGWLRAGFEKAWLTMREAWYDERFANRNWDEVRRKYSQVAAEASDTAGLANVVELMLGELNGSHLGFYPSGVSNRPSVEGWRDETAHLGIRFVEDYAGPGLLVRDVIPGGPTDREDSQLRAGDILLSIDGTPVDPALDLTQLLNGRMDRDIQLRIRRQPDLSAQAEKPQGEAVLQEVEEENVPMEERELSISVRPTSYSRVRSLLYDAWIEHNRQAVEKASAGKLGYLHIRAMDMSSFFEFERQLYNVGYGREGLVIDVRDNGGGSTTDLLLTALTQPRHAITVPRGGGQGYPHDRAVYAYWSKPILVLCNQNSYSNAEIFSHAVKTLGRGKVVGVQTAGGVVSTGSAQVNDVGRIRVPFRGWFVLGSGEDMELNGCQPDVVLWPAPGELPQGTDRQLVQGVELLLAEVGAAEEARELNYASQRDSAE